MSLKNRHIESIFEELEDIVLDEDYVVERITHCKNISIEMLDVLIEFCRDNCNDCGFTCDDKSDIITFCGLKEAKQIIEKATGLTIEEVIK